MPRTAHALLVALLTRTALALSLLAVSANAAASSPSVAQASLPAKSAIAGTEAGATAVRSVSSTSTSNINASHAVAQASLPASPTPAALQPSDTARILPIAEDAWAGTSVNVVAGLQNSLITDRATQYAAFYAADSTLVLARREIGSDVWTTRRTGLAGRTADAHNTVAIAVDGDGFLHVAWDHHDNPLNYARGIAPGSLELGPRQPMTGSHEDSVTYPAFLRLPDGDLLFLYRDGRSGRGNLALDRYSTSNRTWTQVQPNLIDGEGRRSAYPSATVDSRGVLHLAWVWRDSPDVATNHDLCYARSADGGATWTTVAGAPLALPLTAANSDYALRIPTGRSLMNPPAVAADGDGRPCLADYWCPDASAIPQYHLVRHDGSQWQVSQITRRTTPFVLAGSSTKRPPLSRSILVTRRDWHKPQEVYLAYRDDERGGRIVVAECRDLAAADWRIRDITSSSVGAWEPSADPQQWSRFSQLHLLVQHVEQRDGDDRSPAATGPSPIASLIWSPYLAELGTSPVVAQSSVPAKSSIAGTEAGATAVRSISSTSTSNFSSSAAVAQASLPAVPGSAAHQTAGRPINPAAVLATMERAADWQLAQPAKYNPAGWENAPFYIGALALARLSASPRFHDAILARATANAWQPARRLHHADDHCVIQAYAELSRLHRDPAMLAPSRQRLDAILAAPATGRLDWGLPGADNRWAWCDALFMGPVSWLMMYEATGDTRYLDHMNREWWATYAALYVPADRLFARDQSYLDLRERNGRGLYWSRGNGWVAAGLARVLDLLPQNHSDRPRYLALYRDMMETVLAAQQPDGLWRPGLLDPASHTARETSGSSFYTFAIAWGLNRGLLDRARFEPAARRAWLALTGSITPEGKLEYVQPIGAAPEGFDPHNSEPFGVGAFLLAGSEIHRLVSTPAP
jgi:rhamnogalacturonyl hydrolase YesR